MNKKIRAILILALIFLVGAVSAHLEYSNQWYEGTVINGTDWSGATLQETIEAYDQSGYAITLNGKYGGTDTITGEEISLETDMTAQIEALFEQQHNTLFLRNWLGAGSEYTVTASVSYDADALLAALEDSVLVTGSDNYEIIEATDAYMSWSGTAFEIMEDDNNEIIVEKAYAYISEAVAALETEIDLTGLDLYASADVDTQTLEPLCEEANLYALHWLVYDMGDDIEEVLTPDDLSAWITVEDGEISFDYQSLYEWIEDLCLEYKTSGVDREFTTHDGEMITISGGDYGWKLSYYDMAEEALDLVCTFDEDAVADYLEEQTDETQAALTTQLEPTYSQTAYSMDYETYCDWDPDNYSEVDISEQMVYVYQDGELVYSCICVTGLPNGERDTTTGVWYVKDKKTSYTMTSERYGYTTPTKYWVRLTWSGIGYHYMSRSDWGRWSSTLYQTAGSHGCINLQLEDAEAIYNLVEIGDAVFIHE